MERLKNCCCNGKKCYFCGYELEAIMEFLVFHCFLWRWSVVDILSIIFAFSHGYCWKMSCHVCQTRTQISLHTCTVWSVFIVCMTKLCIHCYLKCAQWRFWSDCANAQSDLNLRWAHMSEGTFSEIATQILIEDWQNVPCHIRTVWSESASSIV